MLSLNAYTANRAEVTRRVSEVTDVPVVVLLDRDEEALIAQILEAGAMDCIVKPFSANRLAARIKAFLQKWASPTRAGEEKSFVLGDLAIDYIDRGVTLVGRPVQLTPTEYKLLCELSMNAGNVLTYDHLLSRIWSDNHSSDTQVVRTFVKDLRRKLGDKSNAPAYIFTVPRVGYRMPRP